MFPRSSITYAAAFFVIGSLFGASVSAFIAPTAEVERARAGERPVIPNDPALTPWSEFLSKDAVNSAGVEKDLDGNASALNASTL